MHCPTSIIDTFQGSFTRSLAVVRRALHVVGKCYQKPTRDSADKRETMTEPFKFTRYEVEQNKTCYNYKDDNYNRG
jgi:hypothetical protein